MAGSRRSDGANRLALWMLGLTLVAPLTVMVAAMGTRLDVWGWRFGFDTLAIGVGLWLGVAGVVAALIAAVLGLRRPRSAGLIALAAVAIAGCTAAGYGRWFLNAMEADGGGPATRRPDVTTAPNEPPGYGPGLTARRRAAGAMALGQRPEDFTGCAPIAYVETQVAPEVAGYALQQAGFDVLGAGVGRADGTRTSFWFGFAHDATIRIRPGRTDVRVTAREPRADGGEACRLAAAIVRNLQVNP